MTVGSLFAGIGGFDLAAERVGWTVKWQVEIDPFARRVLEKHWPKVRRYEDVRTVGRDHLEPVDVICGGFPCQDISSAGLRAGIDGDRSGLWREMARIVRELRPAYLIVENVADLLNRGIERVLRDLAACGYDAEWECIPASSFGAPHRRDRVWIVAYPEKGLSARVLFRGQVNGEGFPQGFERIRAIIRARRARNAPPADFCRLRAADGLSGRLDELAAYGNSIVPQVAEWIFSRIQAAEDAMMTSERPA
jgi:DNA (cytosine-5)-methyltransferase 1